MSALGPLPDTERVLDWDELPESVRSISANFDPSKAGVLMAHQSEWIRMQEGLDIAVCEKGRRTGITFAQALSDTITAASAKDAGGDNVWYMADTKEKGLEFIGYVAKFAPIIAQGQASRIEQHIFQDQQPDGTSRQIQAFRVRFASGFRITALSSRPENIHGLQGVVDLDEAALHKDVAKVLESATALLIWGGRIRVWSTHRGKKNPFNQLVQDVQAGRYGKKAGVIRISFDDAVSNGLYERVCAMRGKVATAEGKKEWYTAIRSAYGPRKAAMREELDVIPRDGDGSAIPSVWIDRAMPEVRPVLRLVFDDDFPKRSEKEREIWCSVWIATTLLPVLRAAVAGFSGRWAIGMDFARHRHFSVIKPAKVGQDLRRDVPFLIEMANAPTRQQEQILWALLDALKEGFSGRWSFAGDATGPGQTLMEYTGDRYGRAELDTETGRYVGGPIHEVTLSRPWYGEWMPKYIALFEDGFLSLPRDASLEDDHRAVEYVDGIPMVPRLERKDLQDPELVRHGDGAIAGVLMQFAALNHVTSVPIEFQAAGARAYIGDGRADGVATVVTDDAFGTVSGGNDFGGFV
ncbi:phage protein [Stenotrophomonas maltophilia]|uniref:phage protein n=1 Tax=Stenotrophomonas maltophilia TaxID=40324 RepID=UPI00066A285F|nr:phage protein [Stenotrophomonas maltophilia]